MAVYRDIDADVRISGSLTLPTGSIALGNNITLNTNGTISATNFVGSFSGDGSSITNLSSANMSGVLLLNGAREMTGTLIINRASTHLQFKENGVSKWHLETSGGAFRIVESNSTIRISVASGGDTALQGSLSVNGNIMATGKTITSGTINATSNLQEAGVNLSTKYEPKGTLHDDRYYTEAEIDTKLSGKAAAVHSHDDLYYTEAEVNSRLANKMNYGDVVMNTNPFGGKQLYINSLNNAMFRASERWNVQGIIYNADGTVASNNVVVANLFNGTYENGVTIPAGKYLVIEIDFNGGAFPEYPYGYIYLSHYNTSISASAKLRVHSLYEPHGIGWHEMQFSIFAGNGSMNTIMHAYNGKYQINKMEIIAYAPADSAAQISEIDWKLDRPGSNEMPVIDKFRVNNLYSALNFKDVNKDSSITLNPLNGRGSFKELHVNNTNVSLEGHTHHDLYYTQSQVDSKVDAKANSSHTHNANDINAGTLSLSRIPTGTTSSTVALGNHNHTIDSLSNTNITSAANGHFLRWNGTAWVNANLTAGDIPNLDAGKITSGTFTIARIPTGTSATTVALGNHNHTLDALSNINITSNTNGEILRWNGTAWINNTLAEAGIQPAGDYANRIHVHAIADVTGLQSELNSKSATSHNHTIDSLSNTNITSVASGHFLEWNGSAWINSALVASDIPNLDTGKITSGTFAIARIPTGTTSTTVALGNHNHTLDALSNTTITSIASGEILKWSGSAWINNTLAEAGIQPAGSYALSSHNHTLDGLSNTTITSNTNGEILRWNGTTWVNNTLAEAGIQPAGDYALEGHVHTVAQVTGLQGILDSKAASGHSHAWGDITSKPTTFPPSGHGHAISDITNLQTTLNGKANSSHTHPGEEITSAVNETKNMVVADTRDVSQSPGSIPNRMLFASLKTSTVVGNPPVSNGSSYSHILNMNGWQSGNSGNGGHTSQLAFGDGLAIRLSTSTETWGPWRKFWHDGNLNPLSSGAANQTVGTGFSVAGNLYVGATPSTAGSVQIRNSSGKIAIELGISTKGSDAKVSIKNDGSADFDGTVEVQNLVVMDTTAPMVTNLNSEYLNGVKEFQLAKTQIHTDAVGYGVISGFEVTTLNSGTNVQIGPGVAYTESGIRIELKTAQSISLSNASSSNNRYDVIYMLGTKYENGSNTSTNEGQFAVLTGTVAATPVIPISSLPQGAIPIAALYRLKAASGGNTVVNTNDIDMTVKRIRPINLTNTGITIDRKVDVTGDISSIKGTFKGDVLLTSNAPNLVVEAIGGNSSDANTATLYLKESNDHGFRVEYKGQSNVGALSTRISGVTTERMRFHISKDLVEIKSDLQTTGSITSSKAANTVLIPKGSTSATWTHGLGSTNYAVNLTSNSFARHVRWTNKLVNSIVIEIDDRYDEDILVDCILIGY